MSISYQPGIAEQQWLEVAVRDRYEKVTYEEFVCNLTKECGGGANNLIHMVLGIAGESGELVDAIKKHAIYNKPLDFANIVEELGDLEFYMAGMRQMLGVSRMYTLEANIRKLSKRYISGYSDAAAIARSDKVETPSKPEEPINSYELISKEVQEQRLAIQQAEVERLDSQLKRQPPSNPEVGFPPLSR